MCSVWRTSNSLIFGFREYVTMRAQTCAQCRGCVHVTSLKTCCLLVKCITNIFPVSSKIFVMLDRIMLDCAVLAVGGHPGQAAASPTYL